MGRRRDDRGAETLETALVLPILVMVLFAMIEIGGAMKAYSATAGAVRSAGRAASLAGADPMADASILAGVAKEVGADDGQVELVVIWHATGAGDPVPAGCMPSSPYTMNVSSVGVSDGGTDALGACNVYVLPGSPGGAFSMANGTASYPTAHYFGCQGTSDPTAGSKLDCNWPGKDRRILTTPRGVVGSPRPTDFVGVYVRVRHDYYTKVFGSTLTITDRSISLIEPQGYDIS